MKSNEPNPFDAMEDSQKIEVSKMMVAHATDKVNSSIDELSSSGLKRVLKIVSHVHLGDALLDRPINYNLNEKEQNLIDKIFELQETVFGHQTLLEEVDKQETEEITGTGLDQVDISVSLEENSNE